MPDRRSLTPHFPSYAAARHFLRILNGVPYALYRSMAAAIWSQRGTPQEIVDWSDPEKWIPERLQGQEQDLALRIWRESGAGLNPRYLQGCWMLAQRHNLLQRDSSDALQVASSGQDLLDNPHGKIAAAIDDYEGVLRILGLLADAGPTRRGGILQGWAVLCRLQTNYDSDAVIRHALYDRLMNLIERAFVQRRGAIYSVTDAGLTYLEQRGAPSLAPLATDRRAQLRRLAKELADEARGQLAETLSEMDPFAFERLIGFLLEEMGYTDVEVTIPANDKGVDVVADIEMGISSVREVVQAKRHKGNVNRPTLDQLRGSLHRFNAVQGTIITTGGFSLGARQAAFELGAARITLIDGEKLLDLLIEHGIGVSAQSVDYIEFDAGRLGTVSSEDADEVEARPPDGSPEGQDK